MATPSTQVTLIGLAKRLASVGLLSDVEAARASQEAAAREMSLVAYLVEAGGCDAAQVALCASTEFGLPVLDVDAMDPAVLGMHGVSEQIVRKYRAVPLFRRGNRLFAAVSDPTDYRALDEIKFSSGLSTEAILVAHDKLTALIARLVSAQDTQPLDDINDADLDALVSTDEEQDTGPASVDVDDAPVVRFVNKCLLDAIKRGASDLHFEPYEKIYRVRFRIDGVLQEVSRPPLALAGKIAARIKVMSRLDVSERRVPQDGRIKLKLSKTKAIDFRVSTCPTLFGEKAVLRILDSDAAKLQIDQLGYEDFQKKLFLKNLAKPYGMFLVTGPTGSGKSTTLYSCLQAVMTVEDNVNTVEDPVEYEIEGLNQCHVNPKRGLTFATALRALLRQDPDTIMIGEIRDQETIEIAVKAALTGHLVLSTLHTNDAPSTVNRIVDMGIEPFLVANTVLAISAQRLGRRLCKSCKRKLEPSEMPPKERLVAAGFTEAEAETLSLHAPVGCSLCSGGFKGRFALVECLEITDPVRQIIIKGGSNLEIRKRAIDTGMITLRRAGLMNALRGVTALEEVERITMTEEAQG